MALKNRDQSLQYLKVKDGKFFLSSDKENKDPFDSLEGTITNLYFKDEEYEGKPSRKLYVSVTDNDETFTFGLISESIQATMLLNFLSNADLSKPLTLSPKQETKNVNGKDVTTRVIFVNQNGKAIKSKYSREELPEVKTIMVNKKPVYDKTDLIEFFEKIVETHLKPQFQKVVTTVEPDEPWKSEELVDEDDLPF